MGAESSKAWVDGASASNKTKELDKLGGRHRPPIRRGESMDRKLQWLKAQLEKQQDKIEDALHKDAGNARWEITQQEKKKERKLRLASGWQRDTRLRSPKKPRSTRTPKMWADPFSSAGPKRGGPTPFSPKKTTSTKRESPLAFPVSPKKRVFGHSTFSRTASPLATPANPKRLSQTVRASPLAQPVSPKKRLQQSKFKTRHASAKQLNAESLPPINQQPSPLLLTAPAPLAASAPEAAGPVAAPRALKVSIKVPDDTPTAAPELSASPKKHLLTRFKGTLVVAVPHSPGSRSSKSGKSPGRGLSLKSPARGLFTPKTPGRARLLPQWRMNIKRAKRKLYVAIKCHMRLSGDVNVSSSSGRPRLDDFGMIVSACLGEDKDKFVAEQTKLIALLTKAQNLGSIVASASLAKDGSLLSQPSASISAALDSPEDTPGSSQFNGTSTLGEAAWAIEAIRADALRSRLDADGVEMEKVKRMMKMLVNRRNARWLDDLPLQAPYAFDAVRFPTLLGGEEYLFYQKEVITALQAGQIAVQILATDTISVGGACVPLYTADPWPLLARCCPNHSGSNMGSRGWGLGARMFVALRQRVQALAGKDAVHAMPIVVCVDQDIEDAVVRDLRSHGFFGFDRAKIFVVPQPRHPAYVYSTLSSCFVKDPASPGQLAGTGFSLMQLAWPREALCLGATTHAREFIKESVLDRLTSMGVSWMTSNRMSDLQRCTEAGALELDCLAYTMKLAHDRKASMSIEIQQINSLVVARQQNSLVFSAPEPAESSGRPSKGAPRFSMDVKFCDMSTARMAERLNQHASDAKELYVSAERYVCHLPSLRDLLANPKAFRPDLDLEEQHMHLRFQMSDLTCAAGSKCAALLSKLPLQSLKTPQDMEAAVPLLMQQDRELHFNKVPHVAKAVSAAVAQPAPPKSIARQATRFVVFATTDDASVLASSLAMSLAHPEDSIMLVASVATDASYQEAVRLLDKLSTQRHCSAPITTDVLVRGYAPLVDTLMTFADEKKADLIVMGSHKLSKTDGSIGSVALSCIKRTEKPLLVVKHDACNARLVGDHDKLRIMVAVDHTARPVCDWACSRLVDEARGDKLYLACQSKLGDQDTLTTRRTLDQFGELASSRRIEQPAKRPLTGRGMEVFKQATDSDAIHLIAFQIPDTKVLPPELLDNLRGLRSGMLIYKTNKLW